jgi:glycosyltransferase involved in cell wall biosynthesis
VVAGHPGVELVRQANAGLAAARNRGLAEADTDFVVFLDADDALLPRAIEFGLRCHARHPGCGMVYGGHRPVDERLHPIGRPVYRPPGPSPYRALLEGNFIGSCATVMFDREKLIGCGGFDPELRKCEDYDAYFRLAQHHPVASHPAIVALYRKHEGAMSGDPLAMAEWACLVQQRHRPAAGDDAAMAAWRRGRRNWWRTYANAAWRRRGDIAGKWAMTRRAPLASFVAASGAASRRILPAWLHRRIRDIALRGRRPVGTVDLGDLARSEPVSREFGFDRGTPIDRHYIDRFLARHAGDIRGRVLEVGDASYCRRFGSGIERQDVLDRPEANPAATITGDLASAGTLPEAAFDCMVITQVIQLLYDLPAAVRELHRGLKPGGVLLLTVPGVTSVDPEERDGEWYWALTDRAAARLFGEIFGPGNVEIAVCGNAYAATCFLQGLALEEIDADLLDRQDPAYPMLVCVRARRAV